MEFISKLNPREQRISRDLRMQLGNIFNHDTEMVDLLNVPFVVLSKQKICTIVYNQDTNTIFKLFVPIDTFNQYWKSQANGNDEFNESKCESLTNECCPNTQDTIPHHKELYFPKKGIMNEQWDSNAKKYPLPSATQKLFDAELFVLKKFHNTSTAIIRLLNASPVHMELEFWNRGDLRSTYLRLCPPMPNGKTNDNRVSWMLCLDEIEKLYDWEIKLHIAYQLACGLQSLHRVGLVHGDIKSANVLLDKDWNACWCDFGFAKSFESLKNHSTFVQQGTPFWMPPELLRLDEEACQGPESDIFSFGIILWELVELKTPYPGLNSFDVSQKIPKGYRMAVSESPFKELILRCWDPIMKERPCIDEICQELSNLNAK